MFEKRLLLILASLTMSALIGCSSKGGGDDDLDITEIQEIEQTGEFSEDEFFASEDVDNLDEEQLVDEVPGLEEDLEVTQQELEASGDEGFEIDLAEDEQDLFEESGLAEEDSIAVNNDFDDEELDNLLDEDLGEDLNADLGEDEIGTELADDDLDIESEELALESEDDLFRDLEDDSDTTISSDDTSFDDDQPSSEILAEDGIDYSLEASDNYDASASEIISEDINVDVDYSNALAEDSSLEFGATEEAQAPKAFIPVKKMKTVPYDRNGVLVNAIYFVRQGDTLRDIADKVYGAGSAVDFTIVNPHLNSGNLRVGQKVYYNSPTRPQDRSRLLTYYEDARAPIMYYSASEGDNIREVSKNLLGHSRSWMEVWATNMQIESKASLEAPFQIRYWEGAPSQPSTPVLASNQTSNTKLATNRNNQANLNIEPQRNEIVEDSFEDEVVEEVAVNDTFGSDDLEEPVIEDDFTDELAEDLAAVGSMDEPAADDFNKPNKASANTFDGELANNNKPVENKPVQNLNVNKTNPRNVALNNSGGGFPANKVGGFQGIMNDPAQMGIVGGALLLLLMVGFIVIRRRRAGAEEAIEMESFDFGGETVIDDDINKTQVDI